MITDSIFIINLISALLVLKCLARVSKSDTRSIIGGHPAERYPFYVAVSLYSKREINCGGTIVAENAVVSAAHCMLNLSQNKWLNSSDLSIKVADFTTPGWNQEATVSVFKVIKAVHHEFHLWRPEDGNDISLLTIEGTFDMNYNSILEPCPVDKNYKQAVAIGLGLIQQNPDKGPEVLQEAVLDEDPHCSQWSNMNIVEKKLVCYSVPGKANICAGDSGGPLVYKEAGQVQCLLGITSFSGPIRCDIPIFPGAFTRAGYYADWINDHLH